MGCYNPEDPELSFSYEIKEIETLKLLALFGYEWYLQSEKYKKSPQYQPGIRDNCEELAKSLSDLTPEDIEDGIIYELLSESEFFSSDLYDIVPFEIDIIEGEMFPFLTPHRDKPLNFRDRLSFSLQYGDNISQIIVDNTINFNDPDSYSNYSNFLKLIDQAGLNHIKKEFSWRFLHSSWN